jgi:hypothetical protein
MSYSTATWRIRISKQTFIEVSVKGCDHDRQSVEAGEVLRAASILKDLCRAIDRVVGRWKKVEALDAPEKTS